MTVLRADELIVDIPGRRLLDHLSIELTECSTTAIMGPSGSGKTTLLNCLCGIARPTSGQIWFKDKDLTAVGMTELAAWRLRHVGLMFQFGELLPELTVVENVALPLRLGGSPWAASVREALSVLEIVGLGGRASDNPDVLSGGEVQRVALARAIVTRPAVILADEPTGALDEDNATLVTDILISLAARLGSAVIIATHNSAVASRAGRVLHLRRGVLVSNGRG